MALSTLFLNNTVMGFFEKRFNINNCECSLYMKGNEYLLVNEDGRERCFYPIEVRWIDKSGVQKICIIKPKLTVRNVKAFPFDYITYVYDYDEMERDFILLLKTGERNAK